MPSVFKTRSTTNQYGCQEDGEYEWAPQFPAAPGSALALAEGGFLLLIQKVVDVSERKCVIDDVGGFLNHVG